ncbi:MAG: hypothetical protein U0992_18625 [Planctomycetaceae bacterium]
MSLASPSAEATDAARPRRNQATPTTTPDWLFSAVIHLLLVALLFTSKAGPGGGGRGAGKSGNGYGDFPNDGWIEAQMGSENGIAAPATIAVDMVAKATPLESAPAAPELNATPIPTDTEPTAEAPATRQASYVKPADPPGSAPHPAASSPRGIPDARAAQGSGAHSGRAGRGDGSPGDGGNGKGGTSLFGIWDSGERFVYVIDRSSSMGYYGKLPAARRELEYSLSQLQESIEFQVVFYNDQVQPLTVARSTKLLRASPLNQNKARQLMRPVVAEGGTNHAAALSAALNYRPTVVYLLTDAEAGLTTAEIEALQRKLRGATRIHCIQFGDTPEVGPVSGNWLEQLAAATGGKYVHIRTTELRAAERAPNAVR